MFYYMFSDNYVKFLKLFEICYLSWICCKLQQFNMEPIVQWQLKTADS